MTTAGRVARIFIMHRRWVACSVFVGAVVVGLSLWPFILALELVDGGSGRTVFCARVKPGEEFVLSFVHSVNKRPVYDTLRVERDHLVIVRSRFDAFGAGMPEASTQDGTLALSKDGWLEWTVNRSVPEITVRVGWVADHTLCVGDREIRLADLAEPGQPLTMRVRSIRMFDLLKGRCIP
jgi:hypothetical protein